MDDHPQVRGLIARLLADASIRVIEADSVAGALAVLASPQPVDLLICDLHLSDGTGLELIGKAAQLRHPLPRVLIMSGYDLEGAGYDCILKPFEPDELLQRVQTLAGE